MALLNYDTGLSEQDVEIRDTVHRFAAEVMRPVGQALDKLDDPADVIAPDSPLWEVFEKYRQLGISELNTAEPGADPAAAALIGAIVNEEMGWGDSGLAVSLGVSSFHRFFVTMSGNTELTDRYINAGEKEIGCWSITEPDHGSDSLGFNQPHWSDGSVRANTIAKLDGGDYVINGQKAAWVSNGTIATVAALFCTIDGDKGFQHGGVAIVPLDLPGVSRGKPLDKIGQRALNQGETLFDDVRIPASYMVIPADFYSFTVESVLTLANSFMGACFSGTARAALELAIDYAKERVQGGVPIYRHQSVQSRIFKMFARVEAARALSRRVICGNAANPPGNVQYSIASKTLCTQTAFDVASDALQIFGGNGLTREYPIEKVMRDARASMIEDGCNEILGLVGAGHLFD